MNRLLTIIISALVLACAFAAIAQDNEDQEPASQRNYYSNETPPTNPASLEVRLSQYDEKIRQINGKLEELQFMNRQLQQKLDKAQADNDFRMKQIENKIGLSPAVSGATDSGSASSPASAAAVKEKPNVPASIPGSSGGKEKVLGTIKVDKNQAASEPTQAVTVPAPTPKTPEEKIHDQYEAAFDLLRQSKYDEAISAFEKFAGDNPSSPLTSGAYYWMGEAYFVQKDYENAAKKFVTGYKKFPKGPKAPETLLKLGDSLAGLNKKKEACITYDKLADEFPKMSAAVKKKLADSRQKLSCQ